MKRYLMVDDPEGLILVEDENGELKRKIKLIEIDANGLPVKPLEKIKKESELKPDLNKREEIKHVPDVSLNFYEWTKAKIYHIKREGVFKMLEAIKQFILPKLIQWALKAGGAIFAFIGISSGTVEEIVTGLVVFVFSAIWSLISTGKIALTDPKDFLKIK